MSALTDFKNLLAASRKANLIPFALFPSGQDLTWIENSQTFPVLLPTTGTINGSNATFTLGQVPINGLFVFVNGLFQHQGVQYTWTSGTQTITFVSTAIPQTGDDLQTVLF